MIVDGSPDDDTRAMVDSLVSPLHIKYWKVPPEHRGLTRQRNFGIGKLSGESDIVCFLDDDVILENDYLQLLEDTLRNNPQYVGASGYQTNGREWDVYDPKKHRGKQWFILDGFAIKLGQRNYLRRILGLFPKEPPGILPPFGHGYQIVPPSGKMYDAEYIIGCNMSYRRHIFDTLRFSDYFIGYGLYEDADFSLRTTRFGKLVVNTNMKLEHHHHPAGRPDLYKLGKMVTRNGWYVWRGHFPHPGVKNIVKWYAVSVLFTLLLLKTIWRKDSMMEFAGRVSGIFSVIFNAPHIDRS
jgi:GT2 family glycosyltransferase